MAAGEKVKTYKGLVFKHFENQGYSKPYTAIGDIYDNLKKIMLKVNINDSSNLSDYKGALYKEDVIRFHQECILPLLYTDAKKLTKAHNIFLASMVMIYDKYRDFWSAFLTKSKQPGDQEIVKIEALSAFDDSMDDSQNDIELNMKFPNRYVSSIRNLVCKEFKELMINFSEEFYPNHTEAEKNNFWKSDLAFDFSDYSVSQLYLLIPLDEYDLINQKVNFKDDFPYLFKLTHAFLVIFDYYIFPFFNDKILFNSYETKMNDIVDIIGRLPVKEKMRFLKENVRQIDTLYKRITGMLESLDEVDKVRFNSKKPTRLNITQTAEHYQLKIQQNFMADGLEDILSDIIIDVLPKYGIDTSHLKKSYEEVDEEAIEEGYIYDKQLQMSSIIAAARMEGINDDITLQRILDDVLTELTCTIRKSLEEKRSYLK